MTFMTVILKRRMNKLIRLIAYLHKKNNFAEGSKILLDTDQKIILSNYQNNFVWNLKNNEQKILIF